MVIQPRWLKFDGGVAGVHEVGYFTLLHFPVSRSITGSPVFLSFTSSIRVLFIRAVSRSPLTPGHRLLIPLYSPNAGFVSALSLGGRRFFAN